MAPYNPLPVASLRLLVPPFQLMSASMWQAVKKQDVMNYWKVAEFVSLVMDMVPELLMYKHKTQLNLGLRARYILELCRSEPLVEHDFILSHLDKIKPQHPTEINMKESEEEEVAFHFLELIHTLLKDPEARRDFFSEVFPAEYGPQYDSDLQKLFWEFIYRLAQLLPVPDLEQTVSWLGAECSMLEDCVHSVSEPTDLKNLLQHHKHHGHLEQHVPPSSMGDSILSSLSAVLPSRAAKSTEQLNQSHPLQDLSDDMHAVSYVRTSGRKRKPTMKIQVINLQRHMTTKRKEVSKANPPELKPLPFNCAEHSYGSLVVSSKDSNEADASPTTFSCPKCSFHHSEEAEVQQHIDSVHSIETEEDKPSLQFLADGGRCFCCSDCDKSFKFQSLLKAHRRIHTGEQPFLCSQCGQRFSFKQSLDRHKQTHKSECKYECLICGEFFKSLVAQREHKSTHMENSEYLCSECGRAFAWKSALVRHLKTHGEDSDKVERSHKCIHCDLGFSCASYLNRHLQTHQEERVHTCDCGKSFAYQAALTAHQRIHQKERPHICTQCGKGFLYKGGLLSHMKIHSEEMPFMCSFCGKSFKRERNMKKHERCHTRENVFSCSQCDKSFVYKATLIRHELTHSGERPYLCSDCGKGFFSHAELLKHERFHTGHKPFQCPHCGKKFTQSCYLTIHLRYHTGVRPYSCTECDKSFLSANRLKRHQRTHSGEKPYLCVECGKGFRQSYNLKMHQRTHIMKLT
uniref:C2H2-type domain-containing protein n=1 Tax=Monopterus albus TaxID=43700 RepID=A0A3Q3QNQ4_MONAL